MHVVSRLPDYLSYLIVWRIRPVDEFGSEVLLQQQALVVQQLLVMAVVSTMISGAMALTLALDGHPVRSLCWFMFAFAWSLMIGLGWVNLRNKPLPEKVTGRYLYKAELSAIYYGLVWGSLPLLFDMSNPLYTLLICVVASSMMAGSLALLPNLPRIVFRYAIFAFIPILTGSAISGNQVGILVAVGSPWLILAMLYGGRTSLSQLQQLVMQRQSAELSRKVIVSVLDSIEDPFALFDDSGEILVSNAGYDEIGASGLEDFSNNKQIRYNNQWYLTRVTESTGLGRATTLRNITSLRERQNELEAALNDAEDASMAKNRFLSVMSHQLRSPLSTIIGISSIMGSDSKIEIDALQMTEYSDDIHAAGHELLDSIDGIFAYTSLDENMRRMSRNELYDVQVLISREIEKVQARYSEKNITFEHIGDDEVWSGTIHEPSLRRSVANILDNAARYSYTGGKIRVLGKHMGSKIAISVQDSGPGMDENTLAKARDAFWQTESKFYNKSHGPGLGLAFVNRLAQKSGGILKLESERGSGTTATLVLPLIASTHDEGPSEIKAA